MSRIRFVTLFVITTLAAPSFGLAQPPATGKRYALVIGVNEYHHAKFQSLNYAENDANELGKILKEHGYEVTPLAGKKATLAEIRNALKQITGKRGRDDMVMVALAGHGLLVGADSYYCPHDAEPDDAKSMLGIQELYAELGRCGAGTKLLLVDACREDTVRGIRRNGVDSAPPAPEGVGVLFSCSKGQFSFEAKELKHGVFFYYVLQALKGEVKNKKGEVTWDLLRAHVKEHVPDKVKEMFPGGKQVPNGVENLSGVPALLSLAAAKYIDVDLGGGVKMKMVHIAPGKFMMGSPKGELERGTDESQHEVELTKRFYMGAFTVTQQEYQTVMGKNPSHFSSDGAGKDQVLGIDTRRFPVESVSWEDAKEFCRKLTVREASAEMRAKIKTAEDAVEKGRTARLQAEQEFKRLETLFKMKLTPQKERDQARERSAAANADLSLSDAALKRVLDEQPRHYRLPTEAEWEYACRAGTTTPFHFGETISTDQANYNGNSTYGNGKKGVYRQRPVVVGTFAANAFGLNDMHGNVAQWCEDWYDLKYYDKSPNIDPVNTTAATYRVLRSSGWDVNVLFCRGASRGRDRPDNRFIDLGFRVVLSLP